MTPSVAAFAVAFTSAVGLPTATREVSPVVKAALSVKHPAEVTKPRAALLIHGLKLHLVQPAKATEPEMHEWQKPDSAMVKELGKEFDVYSFTYAQTTPVDAVASCEGLRARLAALRAAGYKEIVLIGHSAGSIVAREVVERYPTAGVTKVIQVAPPNEGAVLAEVGVGLPKTQVGFIKSLAPEYRKEVCKTCSTPIPKGVEFCVVACKYGRFQGDLLVDVTSQWPADLQKLGVPVVLESVSHPQAVKDPISVKEIAGLARGKLVRWDETEVAQARKVLFDTGSKSGLLPKVVGVVREKIGFDKK
jgi:hypothetical protein